MAFAVMKQRFETMLAAENFKTEDLSGMLLRFDFYGAKDDYCSNCHALMISKQGNEFREAVDSIGNAVKFDESLGK